MTHPQQPARLYAFFVLLALCLSTISTVALNVPIANTPPMGWNSWDSFSRTLNEDQIKTTADFISHNLKQYGWQYVVIDEGWYLANLDSNGNDASTRFQLDRFGRYVPVPARFPSAAGSYSFRPLADYIHSLGLKFGIHIIRGIPREAVERNLPIANSKFRAADAADKTDVCPWNKYNYGLKPSSPASQAYYDSLASLYATWGVDFVKVDCISDHPYKGDEIRMFSKSLEKARRPMVLSLSPGPTSVEKRDEVSRYSQMWRISDDVWDVWYSDKDFPTGVKNQFQHAAAWAGVAREGHWPDADMLPIGSLRPAAGWGDPRETRLTRDEQKTLINLWCIFRSPLIMGGNLLRLDNWTKSLLTNAEVIAIDQHSRDNRQVINSGDAVVWTAHPDTGAGTYVAIFNVSDVAKTLTYNFSELGITGHSASIRELWNHTESRSRSSIAVSLAPHASTMLKVTPAGTSKIGHH